MKNKFQRMSKQEKKEAVKNYRNESPEKNKYMSTLNRMLVLGIIGFIYGTLAIIFDIFIMKDSFWVYIVDAVVMIFTVFLIVQRNRIFNAVMNKYVIDKANSENKDGNTTKKRKHVSKNAKAKKKKSDKTE